jgi:hypothetical protein
MSKLSRTKGRAWQAELAKRWRDLGLWICARSTQGEQRALGALGADIEGTPFAVEAKHRRSAQPIQALRQAEDEAFTRGDERPCIAVVREHGSGAGDAVVCMRLGTFEALAASWAGPDVWREIPGASASGPIFGDGYKGGTLEVTKVDRKTGTITVE